MKRVIAIGRLRVMISALALLLGAAGVAVAQEGIIERSYYLSNSFNLLAYNIYMRPEYLFPDDQSDRGAALPSKLRGFDAIVFSEAFDNSVRDQILSDLQLEYPYRTKILGSDGVIGQDGGVIIISRWPITAQGERLYGSVCTLEDCLSQKGVLYARIEKHGRTHHIFASHTQAGDSDDRRQTRRQQFGIIRDFIDSRRPPDTEPVFIAGDLNVDKYDAGEFGAMLSILDAWYPRPFGHPYTVDSTVNQRSGGRSYLDYVLMSNRHLQPINAIIETLIPRSPTLIGGSYHLSDHFPVFGHFMFPSPAVTMAATGD
jgi:endonuclease/exonuclease/phosphatase family metal-dependent hydrolase